MSEPPYERKKAKQNNNQAIKKGITSCGLDVTALQRMTGVYSLHRIVK